jgi:hypothetical protein
MTLTSEAYLRITDDNDDVGLFRFESFEPTATLDKRFLVGGNRGELIGEIADFVPGINSDNASGYLVDVGLGNERFEYLVRLTPEDSGPWGVVDANDEPIPGGQAGGNKVSAHDGDPLTRAEVLSEWVRGTLVDSVSDSGEAFLYKGNWSSGRFANSAGLFGGPLPVAPESVEIRRDPEEPSRVELTIEMLRFENFGVLDGGDRVPDL